MKTSHVTARTLSTPSTRQRAIGSSVEVLESRIAPAVLAAGVFSYTDLDGDTVKVQVSGHFASVTFKDGQGNEILDGGTGNIAKIEIDKPLTDFAMVFADTNPTLGDNQVDLGVISGVAGARLPTIGQISTIDSSAATAFHLAGYIGTDFAANGGLKILGDVTGSSATGGGLDLLNVSTNATVSLRDGVALGATASVAGNIAGNFFVGPVDGNVTVKTISGSAQFGDLSGKITVLGSLAGRIGIGDTAVDINGDPTGLLDIKGGTQSTARIVGGSDLNVKIGLNAGGLIESSEDLTLDVGKSITYGTANAMANVGNQTIVTGAKVISGATIIAGRDLDLTVGMSVAHASIQAEGKIVNGSSIGKDVSASTITSGDDLFLTVGGKFATSRVSSGGDGDVTITGAISTAKISAGGNLTVAGGKGVTASEFAPDGSLEVNVVGAVTGSLLASKDASLEAIITGKLSTTELFSATEMTVTANGGVATSKLTSGSLQHFTTVGKVSGTRFISGDNLVADITGAITTSQFLPGNDLTLTADNNVTGSRLESLDGNLDVTVLGSLITTTVNSGADATLDLHKPVPNSVKIAAAENVFLTATGDLSASIQSSNNVTVTTPGAFIGSIRASGDVTLDLGSLGQVNRTPVTVPTKLGGEVTVPLVLVKTYVSAGGDFSLTTSGGVSAAFVEVGGDITGFNVAGNFNAIVRAAGNFVVGDTINPVTIIGGSTTAGSLIEIAGNVGDDNSTPQLIVAKNFFGRLAVGGKLLTDLEFDGSASRLSFEGGIGAAVSGDNIADIVVAGNLTRLSTGSLYSGAVGAHSGNFVDAGGGNPTGTLNVTGTILQVLTPDFTNVIV